MRIIENDILSNDGLYNRFLPSIIFIVAPFRIKNRIIYLVTTESLKPIFEYFIDSYPFDATSNQFNAYISIFRKYMYNTYLNKKEYNKYFNVDFIENNIRTIISEIRK